MAIPSHGDNAVRCGNCGAVYTALLLVAVPRQTWQLMVQRQGWTVTRAEGSNVLQLTET